MTTEQHETAIKLTDDQWAKVMHCIIVTNHTPGMRLPGLVEIGSTIANSCPEGSAAWFGLAGLRERPE